MHYESYVYFCQNESCLRLTYVYNEVVAYTQLQVDVAVDEQADALYFVHYIAIAVHFTLHVIMLVLARWRLPLALDH